MEIIIIAAVAGLLVGAGGGIAYHKNITQRNINAAQNNAEAIITTAKQEAATLRKEAEVEAKELLLRSRQDLDRELKERKKELTQIENRLLSKEGNIDKKLDSLDQREERLTQKEKQLQSRESDVDNQAKEVQDIIVQQRQELERISGLTQESAKQILMDEIFQETRQEAAKAAKQIEDDALDAAERKAKEYIATAIGRLSSDTVSEMTVSVVDLPNDEMKGRIIGREGRNIRALEESTGINLIIDDTPEAVILSGYDAIKREVARLSLEKLITDGRIHPARIEEVVEKTRKEVDRTVKEAGEGAMYELGINNIHPELVKLVGRLKYRTSYGQNIYQHSIEVAYICGILAAELGVNVQIAKRAGLLHDIGKAVDHEVEGSHAIIGFDLAKKYGEKPAILNAIGAHHGEMEMDSVEAVLVQAGDAISAARPGARREVLENYIKRLKKLEEIADSFEEVEKAFAIQAGREVRIIVKSEQVNDSQVHMLSKDISKKIESELTYPGQIKVTVIRETRSVEYAR
ncbi:ribonuclease Y [Desulfurispira natronophila]|uniref:Ribonuclease Y n=1 Tax=Desulfurispira natronophila TaxID=682562 RepID=A0A7W7Y4Q2_9BACT|nr:ribonuclease Y [Desulfurispira natronophila]MBB5022043.1 ribonuclease Y [Desulfurispira natronophila]